MTDNSQTKAAKATQYLIDSAADIAGAKVDLVKAENMLRVVKSIAMKHSGEKSAAAQEREAYAYSHERYLELLNGLRAATEKSESLRYRMRIAEERIGIWRTREASNRREQSHYGA